RIYPDQNARPTVSADGRWILHQRWRKLDIWDLWSGIPCRIQANSGQIHFNTGAVSMDTTNAATLHFLDSTLPIDLTNSTTAIINPTSLVSREDASAVVMAGTSHGTRLLAGSNQSGEVFIQDLPGRSRHPLPWRFRTPASQKETRTLVDAALSADGSLVALAYIDRSLTSMESAHPRGLILYACEQQAELAVVLEPTVRPTCVSFAPVGRMLAIGEEDGAVSLVTPQNRVVRWRVDSASISGIAWSGDGTRLAVTTRNGRLFELELSTQVVRRVAVEVGSAMACAWLPDRRVLTWSQHGSLSILPLDGGPCISFGYDQVKNRWLCSSNTGIWDGSKNCTSMFDLDWNGVMFAGDVLAPWTNRPDLLLRILRSPAESDIARLHRRVEQRAKQCAANLAQPPDLASLPGSVITNCVVQNDRAVMTLHRPVQARLFQAYANGVPVFSGAGLPVPAGDADISFPISLQRGGNRIETAFLDQYGRSGSRASAFVTGYGDTHSDLHILAIGVSRYRDSRLDLGCAAKDAVDFAKEWQRFLNQPFRTIHSTVLLDQDVTLDNIRQASRKLGKAAPNDVCLLFVAGHGTHDENGVFRFLPHGTQIDDIAGSTISFQEIDAVLGRCGSRRRFAFIDTCESGLLDPDEAPPGLLSMASARGLRCRGLRPVTPADPRPPMPKPVDTSPSPSVSIATPTQETPAVLRRLPPTPSRPRRADRQRYLYNDLSLGSGASILSAASGSQYSYESDQLGNGFFTAAVIKMLRGDKPTNATPEQKMVGLSSSDRSRTITWNSLCADVAMEVDDQTGGLQSPSLDRYNPYANFTLRMEAKDLRPDVRIGTGVMRSDVPMSVPIANISAEELAAGRALAPSFLVLAKALARDRQFDCHAFNLSARETRKLARPLTSRLTDTLETRLTALLGKPILSIDKTERIDRREADPACAEAIRLLNRMADALAGNVPWETALGDRSIEPVYVSFLLTSGDRIEGLYDPVLRLLEPSSLRFDLTGMQIRIEPEDVDTCTRKPGIPTRVTSAKPPGPPPVSTPLPLPLPGIAGADSARFHLC
ncbi:MAG: caspase family protein, partial [Planctomycetota bacterium]